MVNNHYRWDFIGLSTDDKPTSETSEKVVNGSTFYCSDTSKLYVYCDGTWYERKPLGGGGGGGGSYTAGYGIDIDNDEISVDSDVIATKQDLSSKQNTLTAGTNVTISNDTISATDTTYSDFTGTDGTAAGSAGLVPAPATTDAGKFLSASGLWEAVQGGGGGVTELTTADYNYPANNPDGVALWLLEPGAYCGADASTKIYVSASTSSTDKSDLFIVAKPSSTTTPIYRLVNTTKNIWWFVVGTNGGQLGQGIIAGEIVQNPGGSTTSIMSQKAVTDAIAAIPTGGGVTELTTADYNYPETGTKTAIALWLLPQGQYVMGEDVVIQHGTAYSATFNEGDYLWVRETSSGGTSTASFTNGRWVFSNASSTGYSEGPYTSLSSRNVSQTTGTSTTSVMSQNATTSMVFADPSTKEQIKIGANVSSGNKSISIGAGAQSDSNRSIAIGDSAIAGKNGSIALGARSNATSVGEMAIGTSNTAFGYNSSNYRLLTGLYDGQSAHDAATVGQITPTTDSSAPTTATAGRLGEIRIDTTDNSAYMCVVSDSTTPAYEWKKITA